MAAKQATWSGNKGYWSAIGSVRGDCGHRHMSEDTARACAERDHRAVRRAYPSTYPTRAYSDRVAVFHIE